MAPANTVGRFCGLGVVALPTLRVAKSRLAVVEVKLGDRPKLAAFTTGFQLDRCGGFGHLAVSHLGSGRSTLLELYAGRDGRSAKTGLE